MVEEFITINQQVAEEKQLSKPVGKV